MLCRASFVVMAVTVYRYGTPSWIELPEVVSAQLRLAHELRNTLVEISRAADEQRAEVYSALPAVAEAQAVLAQALEVVATEKEAVEEAKRAQRTRSPKTPATARLRAARDKARECRAVVKEAKAAQKELARPAEREIEDRKRASVKATYAVFVQQRGLYWACVDDTTEIMTETGWRKHGDLHPGTLVLTLNTATRLSEWQPVACVNRYDVTDVNLLGMTGQRHDSLTTFNHRWPVIYRTSYNTRSRCWRTSETLRPSDALITGAPAGDVPTEAKWEDAFVELVAWFFTEGTAEKRPGRNYPRVRIYQSNKVNPLYVDRIRRALTVLYGPASSHSLGGGWDSRRRNRPPAWREYIHPTHPDRTVFILNQAAAAPLLDIAPNRVVTIDFVRSLTFAQLELFIGTAVDGDGTRKKISGLMEIAQRDPARLDALEVAALLCGYSVRRYTWRTGVKYEPSIMLSISRRITTMVTSQRSTVVKYTGVVWCPTTPNRTWLARRNGKVWYTGNSWNDVVDHHRVAEQRVISLRQQGRPAELRFRRFTGGGALAVQLQRQAGAPQRTPELLASGTGTWRNVLRTGTWMPPEDFAALPRTWRTRQSRSTITMRVGDQSVEIPSIIHRMLPADADVTGARLVVQRVAADARVSVSITAKIPDPLPASGPTVAVHCGWRREDDDAVRVATWRATEPIEVPEHLSDVVRVETPTTGIVVLPAQWREGLARPDKLRSQRDLLLDPVRDELVEWLQHHPQEDLTQVSKWRSPGRFAAVAIRWRSDPPSGGKEIAARLEAWRRADKALWQRQEHGRNKHLGRRTDAYRRVAAWLSSTAGRIVVDDTDLAALTRSITEVTSTDSTPAEVTKVAAKQRVDVAPGEFRAAVVAAATRDGVQVVTVTSANLTREHTCGYVLPPDKETARPLLCNGCGRYYDPDTSATMLMLLRAQPSAA